MKRVFVLKKYFGIEEKLEQNGFKLSTIYHKSYRVLDVELSGCEVAELSRVVVDFIKLEYEKKQIEKYIKKHGYRLLNVKAIASKVREYISTEKNIGTEMTIEKRVYEMVSNYVEKNEFIDLDGLIKFRMKFYKDVIADFVEMSIYDLQLESEYGEFISELGYFVNRQKPVHKLVGVVLEERGYAIIDKDSNKIEESEILRLGSQIGQTELSKEELIMGTLISTAPETIHIYRDRAAEEELVAEIEAVFKGKVKHIFKDKTV